MKFFFRLYLVLQFTVSLFSCSGDDNESSSSNFATVDNLIITNVSSTSATAMASITDNGGSTISNRGFCWSVSPNPDLSDNSANYGSGTGSFTGDISGLDPDTTYYMKAFAQNEAGISYSSEISFFTGIVCNSSVYTGNVILTTQSEINSFGAENYCIIDGEINIGNTPNGSSDPILSLSALSSLQKVNGLLVWGNPVLQNFDGLENLTEISERIAIYNNDDLIQFNALSNVTSPIGFVLVERNEKLQQIDGLSGISSGVMWSGQPPTIFIHDNDVLQNINGLSNLSSMEGGALFIWLNPLIEEIDALSNIPPTIRELSFFGNQSLTSLSGISHLQNFDGTLYIESNSSLTGLNDLQNLSSIGGGLVISYNDGLTSLEGLNNLTNVGGSLIIKENDYMITMSGLNGLISAGMVEIHGNGNINNLDALVQLSNIQTDLEITRNALLTDFCGLQNLVDQNGIGGVFIAEQNAYNPTLQNLIDGNCSQ